MLSELSAAAEFNPFFKYESPERAFAHFNKGEVVEVVEGRETGLIVYKDDNTTGLALLPKSKNGAWKIRTLWSKTVYQKAVRATDEGCTVTILQARGTDDFYVNICDDFSHSKPAVSDNRGSDFLYYEEQGYFNTAICFIILSPP